MTACLTFQPLPPPFQLFMLNHFSFATWKKAMSKTRIYCACIFFLNPFQATENSEKRVEFSYLPIKAQNVKTKRQYLSRQQRLPSLNLLIQSITWVTHLLHPFLINSSPCEHQFCSEQWRGKKLQQNQQQDGSKISPRPQKKSQTYD